MTGSITLKAPVDKEKLASGLETSVRPVIGEYAAGPELDDGQFFRRKFLRYFFKKVSKGTSTVGTQKN